MSTNTNDLMAEIAEHHRKRVADAQSELARLVAEARAQGYRSIVYPYNGCGDSGAIENPEQVEPDTLPASGALLDQIADQCCKLLPAGWEINEGSQGAIHVDIAAGTIRIEHEWNIERTQDETFHYELAPGKRLPDGMKRQIVGRLLTALRTGGYRRVQISYYGSGGDGTVGECVTVTPATLPADTETLASLAEALTPALPDGWNDALGSEGVLDLNVETGKLTVRHGWREIGTEAEETVFTIGGGAGVAEKEQPA